MQSVHSSLPSRENTQYMFLYLYMYTFHGFSRFSKKYSQALPHVHCTLYMYMYMDNVQYMYMCMYVCMYHLTMT